MTQFFFGALPRSEIGRYVDKFDIFFTHFFSGAWDPWSKSARQKHKIVDVLELFHQLECFIEDRRMSAVPSKNIDEEHITPRKLTQPLKNDDWKTIRLLKWSLFQGTCYVFG